MEFHAFRMDTVGKLDRAIMKLNYITFLKINLLWKIPRVTLISEQYIIDIGLRVHVFAFQCCVVLSLSGLGL